MASSKGKTILFTLLVWLIIGVCIELAAGFVAGNAYMDMDVIDDATEGGSYGYLQPNQNRTILFPGLEPYKVTVNSLGLRSTGGKHSIESIQDKYRILCVGDSNTFGLFTDDESSYPHILQQRLNERNPAFAVLNAGLGGTAIHDVVYYLKKKGLELNPNMIVVNYSTNDFDDLLREIPIYEEIKKDRLTGFKRTFKQSNFGRAFRKVYVHFKYRRFLKKVNDPKVLEILKNQSKDLQDLLYVAELYETPSVVKDPKAEDLKKIWTQYFQNFEELLKICKERNIKLTVVMQPDILKVFDRYPNGDSYQMVMDRFVSYGVPVIDVTSEFRKREAEIQSLYVNPPRDFHLNGQGNAIVVEALLPHMPSPKS